MSKVLYFEGIDDVFFVPITTPDAPGSKPVYAKDEMERLAIAVKLSVKGNGSEKTKYASSKIFRRVSKETEQELGLDHVGMPIDLMDKLQGITATKGVVFKKAEAKEMPYFGFGFIGNIEGGKKMAVWYPRVQLSAATELEYETTTEDDEIKDVGLSMTASPLLYNGVINAAFDETRTNASGLTLDQFISEVIFEESQLTALEGE